jgi:hypothetical protein
VNGLLFLILVDVVEEVAFNLVDFLIIFPFSLWENFSNNIGFLHPDKIKKLLETITDYVDYTWNFPENEKNCRYFLLALLKNKIKLHKPYRIRIFSREVSNLQNLSKYLKNFFDIESLVSKRTNGLGTIYYELNIYKKSQLEKLIKLCFTKSI